MLIIHQIISYSDFEKLPDGWNPFVSHKNLTPTAWLISLAGIIFERGK